MTTVFIPCNKDTPHDGITITLWEGTSTGEISFCQGGICYMDGEIDSVALASALENALKEQG